MVYDSDKNKREDIEEQIIAEQKEKLRQYMKENSDKAQGVRQYMLKRLLEEGERKNYDGGDDVIKQDTTHVKKIFESEEEIREDVYREYQKEVILQIKNDLFKSLNAVEKRAIAISFDDVDADVEINGEKYKREFSEDSRDEYFKKNGIEENKLTHDMDRERKVMDQIAEIFYGKNFNELVDLQINPEKTKHLKPGDQIKLDFS